MSSPARQIFAGVIAAAAIFVLPASALCQSGDQKPSSTGTISGRVTIGGKAAAHVTVAAYASESIGRRIAAAKSITDNEGKYRLSGLPPSQYQVTSLTPDLTAADQGQENNFGFIFFGSSKNILLAAGEEVENIDIKLVKGGVITGRVTDANNKPVIEEHISLVPVDQTGNQLRNARMPMGGEMYQTDDRGIYRIYGLAAGGYKVSVGLESGGGINFGPRGYYPRTFYPDTTEQNKARVVEVTEGTEATGIDIQVGRQEETYRAAGRVVDSETGQPIAGARVSYMIATENPDRYSPFYVGTPTNVRGEFQLTGLSPGHYGVYISSQFEGGDYYSDIAPFDVIDKDVTGVEVKATLGLTISGFVVIDGDAQKTSKPQLERLRISANSMQQSNRPQERNGGSSGIAPDGSFRIGGLRAGRFSLFVYSITGTANRPSTTRIERGGIGVTQGLELQAGQSASDVRVFINYWTGTIRGTVKFVGGVLSTDSRVIINCTREGARAMGGSNLDSRGRFLIKDLAPGTYEVTLQILRNMNSPTPQRPGPPQKQFVEVTNDSESEVTFVVDLTPKEGP